MASAKPGANDRLDANEFPTQFCDQHTVASFVKGSVGEPVWLFATASQLWQMKADCSLPDGSVVIETGGSKVLGSVIPRDQLYDKIANQFSIAPQRIVSEYGMSELASQAYDWVSSGDGGLASRRFRFPTWCRIGQTQGLSRVDRVGEGMLVIIDGARLDVSSAIRCEDLVEVDEDGGFVLGYRVPAAPLKGCSSWFDPRIDEVGANSCSVEWKGSSWKLDEPAVARRTIAYRQMLSRFL